MYIVTGGAGFIGSNLVYKLQEQHNHEVVVCDLLGTDHKWKNIAKRLLSSILRPEELYSFLNQNVTRIEGIFHLGALSSTTEYNVDAIVANNFRLSQTLWSWCAIHKKPLIYASSAATYGDGSQGFSDREDEAFLKTLRPLNPYGWSKHVFDRWFLSLKHTNTEAPSQCVGLKFFNVYGPNEYHKEGQKSVACHMVESIKKDGKVRLFKSTVSGLADGEQKRDFVYVEDCVDVMLWCKDTPHVSGLFNVGSGVASSFNQVAHAVFSALGRPANIEYIDMPVHIADHYQSYTQADMTKLKKAGYTKGFTSLEKGIEKYVKEYLCQIDPYV